MRKWVAMPNNMASIRGLAKKATSQGVQILEGVCVTGVEKDAAGAVTSVVTDQGTIACDYPDCRRRTVGQIDLGYARVAEIDRRQGPGRKHSE